MLGGQPAADAAGAESRAAATGAAPNRDTAETEKNTAVAAATAATTAANEALAAAQVSVGNFC